MQVLTAQVHLHVDVFSTVNTTVLHDLRLVSMQMQKLMDTEEANSIDGGLTVSYTRIFNCVEGWCPNSHVVQGPTVVPLP